MRFSGFPRLLRAAVLLAATAAASALFAVSPTARAAMTKDASSANSPTPTPVNAFLSLDVTSGGPTTVINVTGGQFLPNQAMTLYWDTQNHVAGSATADASGSFNTRVKPFAGDPPGQHKLCASVVPNPCAFFNLEPATPSPSPSPSESPSPSRSPSPEESPSFVASPARISPTLSGFDVISRPPFVFLPLFGLGAILLSLGYWAFKALRRPRRPGLLPSAAVVHRATRPDYSASFGAAPAAPRETTEPSAWDAPMRQSAAPPEPPAAALPAAEPTTPEHVDWGAPVEWGTGTSEWGTPEPPPQDEPKEPQSRD